MYVFIKDGNIESAVRFLRKRLQRDGLFKVWKKNCFYEKSSDAKRKIRYINIFRNSKRSAHNNENSTAKLSFNQALRAGEEFDLHEGINLSVAEDPTLLLEGAHVYNKVLESEVALPTAANDTQPATETLGVVQEATMESAVQASTQEVTQEPKAAKAAAEPKVEAEVVSDPVAPKAAKVTKAAKAAAEPKVEAEVVSDPVAPKAAKVTKAAKAAAEPKVEAEVTPEEPSNTDTTTDPIS